MISKNELKYFSSLLQKKFRMREKKFIAEGEKIVEEGLQSNFVCEKIFVTNEYSENKKDYLKDLIKAKGALEILRVQDFLKLTDTVNTQGIAALFQIPQNKIQVDQIDSDIVVCLENISDPGNAGTIIRNSDWFGIKEVILTKGSAEIYNPKTIRASMGSIFHLKILADTDFNLLSDLKKNKYKIISSDTRGKSIHEIKFPEKFIIVFSNESSGPSAGLLDLSDEIITIPRYGKAESLNVASASAVILSRIKSSTSYNN